MAVANEVEKRHASAKSAAQAPDPARGQEERRRLWMMILIRRFEEAAFREYLNPKLLPDGTKEMKIGGFCHLYNGQEAVAVGISSIYQKGKDYLINGYRDHGHSLALGMDAKPAMAELFGRSGGCSKGKGGSMHFFQAEVGNLGGHGIVGGHIPLGTGAAFAAKYKKTGGVCFTLFGDGAINQGTHNESLNLASLLKLPVIFIVENNGMAMGTQVARHSAEKDLAKRAMGYNMPTKNIDGNDVDVVIEELSIACQRARAGEGPSYIVANTYRFRGHSMSDPLKYRSKEEAERAKQRDPILMYQRRLRDKGLIDDAGLRQIEDEIEAIVAESVQFANSSPHPDLSELYSDVLAEKYPLSK